jgi:uncharacterized protein
MIRLVLGAVAIYLMVIALLFVFQRRFMYLPDSTRSTPGQSGVAEMHEVALKTADALELVAWWRPPVRDDRPVLVYFHGNAGNIGGRGDKVRPYLDAGWGVLLTSWRGYSGNPGSPTEPGLYADGRAALEFLAANGVAPGDLVLYGESLGSGVAVQSAVEPGGPFRALVLEAPFTSIADVAARRFPFAPVRSLLRDRFDSKSKIADVRIPVLVLHGERDGTVPVDLGRELFEAANLPKAGKFFPEAGHNDLYEYGAAGIIMDYIENIPKRLK